MCGFTGLYKFDASQEVSADLLDSRTVGLMHRGPESTGKWIGRRIGLAHARLEIVDPEHGQQPMLSASGTVLSYNGEIYNNTELRAELSVRGYRFQTRSDTEVLLAAYETWGEQAWHRLNGMFAFALYDPAKECLYLVRDRQGVKPLYYTVSENGVEFGSEPAAWEHIRQTPPEVDAAGLIHFLRFAQPVYGSRCVHKNLHSVEPGSQVIVRPGGVSIETWWNPPPVSEPPELDEVVIRAKLRHLLHVAVGRQGLTETPVGVFLSGGIDSAVLVDLMSQISGDRFCTFTAALQGDEEDLAAARKVAERLKTRHVERIVTPAQFFDGMRELTGIRCMPAALPNEILIYLLSQRAAEYVKVILSGEGADELFGGYNLLFSLLYKYERAAEQRQNGDSLIRDALKSEFPDLDDSSDSRFFGSACAWFGIAELSGLMRPEWKAAVGESARRDPFAAILDRHRAVDRRNRFYRMLEFVHLPHLLARLDAATMAASVEGRVPYTDHDLVDFVLNLPPSLKYAPETGGKRLLREAWSDRLPPDITTRPKRAFHVPLEKLFASAEGREVLKSMCENDRMLSLFDADKLKMSVSQNASPATLTRMWLLCSVYMWLNCNIV